VTRPIGERVGLQHGAGGRAMRDLIKTIFVAGFAPTGPAQRGPAWSGDDAEQVEVGLAALDDGAAIRIGDQWLVLTTDSHVVKPRFFPGGDIGRLAISGTVNDLAMMGATEPLALTCAILLEEGFSIEELARIRDSMRAACDESGATVVTGDTKVMGKGELDGCAINTAGVGLTRRVVRSCDLRPGDRILVSGTIGDHGFTILAARHKLELTGDLRSDVAPVNGLVRAALAAGGDGVIALKDPTRGGVASALHELAEKSGVGILLDETAVPVRPEVRAASDLLGIDPLHAANEGKVLLGVRAEAADRVLAALLAHPQGRAAAIVGTCLGDWKGKLIVDTGVGRRLLAEVEGEPMPRIC
jgi:hydrogenase expression/formation protein HypE